jgi:hypothetical protein
VRATISSTIVLAIGGTSGLAHAQDAINFEAYAALEFDGRVRVDELDIDRREGDFVALVETKARARAIDETQASLTFGYDLSQRSHFDFPDLDRQSHRFSADGRIKAGPAELGAAYDFIHFRLGGDALVNIQGIEPRLTVPVSQRTRVTASYRYENWNYVNLDARDTYNHMIALNVAHQFSTDTQLTARIRFEDADAVGAPFDLHGFQLNAALALPLRVIDRRDTARIEFEYRDRDYENVTPLIGERRREDRSVITATSDIYLSDRIGVRTAIRYTDRNSNFPTSNYEEIRASTGFVVRL